MTGGVFLEIALRAPGLAHGTGWVASSRRPQRSAGAAPTARSPRTSAMNSMNARIFGTPWRPGRHSAWMLGPRAERWRRTSPRRSQSSTMKSSTCVAPRPPPRRRRGGRHGRRAPAVGGESWGEAARRGRSRGRRPPRCSSAATTPGPRPGLSASSRWFRWQDVIDLGGIAMSRGTEMYLPLWARVYGALQNQMFTIKVVR